VGHLGHFTWIRIITINYTPLPLSHIKWRFPKMVVPPIAGCFISWKILLKWMIHGYPHFNHFRKPPYMEYSWIFLNIPSGEISPYQVISAQNPPFFRWPSCQDYIEDAHGYQHITHHLRSRRGSTDRWACWHAFNSNPICTYVYIYIKLCVWIFISISACIRLAINILIYLLVYLLIYLLMCIYTYIET